MEIQQEKEHKSAHVFLDLHYFHLLEKEKKNWTKCEKHEKKKSKGKKYGEEKNQTGSYVETEKCK